ncbi:hypothetical protein [Fodinibius sp. Rm-B-1B1-1]|uniref:hypothetical protein n=1 Tax=Fodinibius alkaliphilus TaxID=3140241 RepID=UPI003159F389
MFTLYHQKSDTFTNWVENKLQEMVVAHKVVDIDEYNSDSLPENISTDDLPILSDGHKHCSSPEEIKTFLEELDRDLQFSRSLTSDACVIDPDNPKKCL